jgi:hypothetical protein
MAHPNFHPIGSAHPDAQLLELGSRLAAAVAEENALFIELRRSRDELNMKDLVRELKFRAGDDIDRHILDLLGEKGWPDGGLFSRAEVDYLRGLGQTGTELAGRLPYSAVKARIKRLINANDAVKALTEQPHILELESRCDQAYARTGEIVALIEVAPASTIDGLVVKAKAVRWCRTGDIDDEELSDAATDTRICQSILRDLAALGA